MRCSFIVIKSSSNYFSYMRARNAITQMSYLKTEDKYHSFRIARNEK